MSRSRGPHSAESVAADLRDRIADGRWPPSRVRTYADIRQSYGVSHVTVAAALTQLREAGLVETRRVGSRPKVVGRGWPTAAGTSIQDDITARVRKQVAQGVYATGSRIPSLAALAGEYSVSVATARRALRPLLEEGILVSRRPHGTFVAKKPRNRRGDPG
ncbi:GntR family transcriptional regulator [Streptomyces rubiginosohelvolus]|uniref:GntR family transcriptional regulator n=1 Tax=Streptomyces rubiginosohelvolus TaxID=67362 RepID=UPI0036B55ADC